jgi:CheY-like chemotaxis protein
VTLIGEPRRERDLGEGLGAGRELPRGSVDPESAQIPVIIASIMSSHEAGPSELPLSGWIEKPFDEKALAVVIDRAFSEKPQRPRLMLVEDDEDLAAVIVESFERHGIETIHARDGTEAIELLLRYAFGELGLNRVGLSAFEFNGDAIAAYQKLGFSVEGRYRQAIKRKSSFHDAILMSIIKGEWQAGDASS